MIGAFIAAAAVGETLGARIGVRLVIPAGLVAAAAGLVVLARATAHGGYAGVALALAVFGAGLGLGLPLEADAVLGTLPAHQAGMGNALSRTLQSAGVALGTAVLGSVLSSAYRGGLAGRLDGVPPAAANAAAATAPPRACPARPGTCSPGRPTPPTPAASRAPRRWAPSCSSRARSSARRSCQESTRRRPPQQRLASRPGDARAGNRVWAVHGGRRGAWRRRAGGWPRGPVTPGSGIESGP
jgi:MFS family permease